jgi:hypothetical protein
MSSPDGIYIPATVVAVGGTEEQGMFQIRFARGWEGNVQAPEEDIILKVREEEFFGLVEAYADGPAWMLNHGAAGLWVKLEQADNGEWSLHAVASPATAEDLWGSSRVDLDEDPGVLNEVFGQVLSTMADHAVESSRGNDRASWVRALIADPTYPTMKMGVAQLLADADMLMLGMLNHIERFPIIRCDRCDEWTLVDTTDADPDDELTLLYCPNCIANIEPSIHSTTPQIGEA